MHIDVAMMTAHRACCNEEHDPLNGKISGFCVVCGVPWPCDYADPSSLRKRAEQGDKYPQKTADGVIIKSGMRIWRMPKEEEKYGGKFQNHDVSWPDSSKKWYSTQEAAEAAERGDTCQ